MSEPPSNAAALNASWSEPIAGMPSSPVESALRESEIRLRTVVQHTREAIAVHQNGIVVFVNPATVLMMGAESEAELLGKLMLEFVHPDYRALVIERLTASAPEGLPMPMEEENLSVQVAMHAKASSL